MKNMDQEKKEKNSQKIQMRRNSLKENLNGLWKMQKNLNGLIVKKQIFYYKKF